MAQAEEKAGATRQPKIEAKAQEEGDARKAEQATLKAEAEENTCATKLVVGKNQDASKGDEVLRIANEWASAWSSKDVNLYLSFYADDFKTPGGESRSTWNARRHERITGPKFIHVSVCNPEVIFKDDRHASVSFKQFYRSSGMQETSNKTLMLVKSSSHWKIQEEHSGK